MTGELFSSVVSAGVGVHAGVKLMAELTDMALEKLGVPE